MKNLFLCIKLVIISIFCKLVATLNKLPSGEIDTFARIAAIRYARKLGWARAFLLFVNPISSVRYFEFDFVKRKLGKLDSQKILDISSARLFGIYLASKYPKIKYQMINPDVNDVEETNRCVTAIGNLNNFSVKQANALNLPYKDSTFDFVITISVVEHIDGSGDSKAMREMWRVLKPGGRLIITTHVSSKYIVEYRGFDQYNLGIKRKRRKYFFQRIYDEKQLKERIFKPIRTEPKIVEIWGEKEKGWFNKYVKRWIKNKWRETVYDPCYMINQFKKFNEIKELPGSGVIGMVFQK